VAIVAIVFSCGCGKQLRARDEFAGRKIKCPGCQAVLLIPAPADASAAAAAKPVSATQPLPDGESPVDLQAEPLPMNVAEAVTAPATVHSRPRGATHSATRQAISANPWVDRSLEQTATPWLGKDQERFQRNIESPPGSGLWLILAASVVVLALTLILLIA
jgi:hypothetical protein